MTVSEEKKVLEEYAKAFRTYYNKKVVDLDKTISVDCLSIRLEHILSQNGTRVPPYRQSRFVIIYVTKGSGEKVIGKYKIAVKDHTLMVIPGGVTSSSSYDENTKGYYLFFNLNFFLHREFPRHYLQNISLFNADSQPYTYVEGSSEEKLGEIFEVIDDEIRHQRKNKKDFLALKLLELILVVDRALTAHHPLPKRTHPPLLLQYIDLVQEQYKEHHLTAHYARQLNIHPNALNALTKRQLGNSAKTIIDDKLIKEARYLLQQTALSVKEVAYELGFQSPSHFFRFFKRHTGNTPAASRHQLFEIG